MDGRRVDRGAAARLGRNVFMARRRAGFSQEALGALASVHRTEVGLVEKGDRLPRVDTLIKLASALGVDAGKLLEGVDWVVPAPTRPGSFVVSSQPRGGDPA
ncbi:MAG: helix-turn-helix domain-containing protein [Solirubrobacterales bacterium]